MTWTLNHDNRAVGEWSDDIVLTIATKLRRSKSKNVLQKEAEKLIMIAKFLLDRIRDVFAGVN
jgi:hypothetical protein